MARCWKDVYFISYESVDNDLYTHGVSSKDELCDVHERGSNSGEEKERTWLNQKQVFAKICTAYKTVKLFFSMHNIFMCYEQNIVFLELVLFGLKCMVFI